MPKATQRKSFGRHSPPYGRVMDGLRRVQPALYLVEEKSYADYGALGEVPGANS